MPLWRFFGLLFLGLAGILLLTMWFFPTAVHFRMQNPFWNGLGGFGKEFHATPLESLAALPQDVESSVLLLIPYSKPTEADVARLRAYLEGGGVLILADDYGYGNTVLEGLGVSVRFSGGPPVKGSTPSPEGGGIVILMDLVAGNAEEADWLGYHLITSALTAAREGLPSALTAYNREVKENLLDTQNVLCCSENHPESDHQILEEFENFVLG
jgi:hypothetical protein